MSSPPASTACFRTLLRRFRRHRAGDAIVQFALIAPIFFALLFAIIESGIMFFANQVLETVTQNSARLILTGQAQNGSLTKAQFKNTVCNANSMAGVLFNCNNIYVDVESFPSFASISFPNSMIDASGHFVDNTTYDPGGSSSCSGNSGCANSIVVVRAFYGWQLFVTGLGFNLSNMTGSQRLLVATAVFRNEPY
jgi:Flp pilus assembly protein TadG